MKDIKKMNQLLEGIAVALGSMEVGGSIPMDALPSIGVAFSPEALALEFISAMNEFEIWRERNKVVLSRPEGMVVPIEQIYQFLRAKLGQFNLTNDAIFAVIDQIEKMGWRVVAVRVQEYDKPFFIQDLLRYHPELLGQDSVTGRFEGRERLVREGWGDDEGEEGEEEEGILVPEKGMLITVGDKFLTITGGLSDEYPDAEIWGDEDEVLDKMREVASNPKYKGKDIEVIQGYGYVDKVVDRVVGGEAEESLEEARTIGTRGKKMVTDLVKEALSKGIKGIEVADYVLSQLPSKVRDSWEGAESEIERIVDDTIMTGQRGSDPWHSLTHPGK